MLRASHRVLKPGGRTAFLVIAVAEGLAPAARAAAIDVGPDEVSSDHPYPALVRKAGFTDPEVIDVSDEYAATLAAWIREWEAERDALTGLLARGEFTERQTRRRRALGAVRRKLLRRYLISASRP